MDGPVILAQASTAGTVQDAQKKLFKVVKVTKPSDGQAITVELSHDQPTKIDLTAIAGENFTLTRIGDKLIFLFDNRSTVTIESFSMNVASPAVTFEVSPGHVVGVTEFATLFSIATDPSELPADGKHGAPPSGGDFSNPSVGPLGTPDQQESSGPLPLLSQEFRPDWNTNFAEPSLLVNAIINLGGAGSDTGGIDTQKPTVIVDIADASLNDGDISSVEPATIKPPETSSQHSFLPQPFSGRVLSPRPSRAGELRGRPGNS